MTGFGWGVAHASSQQQVLLVVGDSLSAAYNIPEADGWVALLKQRLQARRFDFRVVNASIPGETTAGGLSNLPALLGRYHPAIMILELGGNDGLQGLGIAQMEHNLAMMVSMARRAHAKVLLVGVRLPPNYGKPYVKRFEGAFRRVAKQLQVPLVPELLAGVGSHRQLMQPGGIHPLAKAEPRLLENVWPHLKPLLGAAGEPKHL